MTSSKVLLLGEDARMVLASLRALGRKGLEVHLAWCPENSPAQRSRYLHRAVDLPGPSDGTDWRNALRGKILEEKYDLVIPVTEAALVPLQAESSEWSDLACLHLLESEAFETFSDKLATQGLAEELGVPVPSTIRVESASALDEAERRFGFPLIVKPDRSTSAEHSSRKHFVRRVQDRSQLDSYVDHLRSRGVEILLQEWLPGRGVGVEFIADRGEILSAFQHRRLHETLGHGSTYRESTEVDPELLRWTQALCSARLYTGLGMAEFRVDPATEKRVLLEVNGRMWGSIPLAVSAGAPFPFYLYQLLVLGERELNQNYRAGVRSRNLFGDFRWVIRALSGKSDKTSSHDEQTLGWDITPACKGRILKDCLRALTFQDRLDSFALDDPLPGVVDAFQLFTFVVKAPLRRLARKLRPVRRSALEH